MIDNKERFKIYTFKLLSANPITPVTFHRSTRFLSIKTSNFSFTVLLILVLALEIGRVFASFSIGPSCLNKPKN